WRRTSTSRWFTPDCFFQKYASQSAGFNRERLWPCRGADTARHPYWITPPVASTVERGLVTFSRDHIVARRPFQRECASSRTSSPARLGCDMPTSRTVE